MDKKTPLKTRLENLLKTGDAKRFNRYMRFCLHANKDFKVDLANTCLKKLDLRNFELRQANLRGANLEHANLSGVNASGVCFNDARLNSALLENARLEKAEFHGACLIFTNFQGAHLSKSVLNFAKLHLSNMKHTTLDGADLRWANIGIVDMTGAKGLASQTGYVDKNFEKNDKGLVVYTSFGDYQPSRKYWTVRENSIISENCDFDRAHFKSYGVCFGNLVYLQQETKKEIWECLIEWPWLAGVCIPFNSDGHGRCEQLKLIKIYKEAPKIKVKTRYGTVNVRADDKETIERIEKFEQILKHQAHLPSPGLGGSASSNKHQVFNPDDSRI